MVSVLASRAVDRGFELWSSQNNDYKIGICSFSASLATLLRMSKDLLTQDQDIVSERNDMFIDGLLFQWASTIKIKQSVLV
jgi:hypothetical protein